MKIMAKNALKISWNHSLTYISLYLCIVHICLYIHSPANHDHHVWGQSRHKVPPPLPAFGPASDVERLTFSLN